LDLREWLAEGGCAASNCDTQFATLDYRFWKREWLAWMGVPHSGCCILGLTDGGGDRMLSSEMSGKRPMNAEACGDISVRLARTGDGAAILRVHRRAIHEIACGDYPADILAAWGPPIPAEELPRRGAEFDAKASDGQEVAVVAEIDGQVAGFGEIVPSRNQLLAVYVNPDFARRGVGTAILRELERRARDAAVPYLEMDSSLTAAAFYSRHGYREIERGVHRFRNGAQMACVKMKKMLA
jgi:putative acetyltransferase